MTVAVVVVSVGAPRFANGFFFDGRWFTFALGILVYWTLNYAAERTASCIKLLLLAGSLCEIIALSAWPRFRHHVLDMEFRIEIFAALLFATALLYLRRSDESITSNRMLAPITWCGGMCYSLYLTHWPVVKALSHWLTLCGFTSLRSLLFVLFPICVIASVLVARVFFLLVERRFLNPPTVSAPAKLDIAPVSLGPVSSHR